MNPETSQEVDPAIIEQISENPEQEDEEVDVHALKLQVATLEAKLNALIEHLDDTHQIDSRIVGEQKERWVDTKKESEK